MNVKKIIKSTFHLIYILFMVLIIILAGCRALTPMPVPPLTEKLGFNVPSYKGWTTIGLTESTLKIEELKLKTFNISANEVIKLTDSARSQAMDWLTMLGLGGTAGLPIALRLLPKGAVSKEDHEKALAEASHA